MTTSEMVGGVMFVAFLVGMVGFMCFVIIDIEGWRRGLIIIAGFALLMVYLSAAVCLAEGECHL